MKETKYIDLNNNKVVIIPEGFNYQLVFFLIDNKIEIRDPRIRITDLIRRDKDIVLKI
jgi:hypothetical protein